MDGPTSYFGELIQEIFSESGGPAASLSLGELWLLTCAILMAAIGAIFCSVLIGKFLVRRYRVMSLKQRRRIQIGFAGLLIYICLYFGSTTVVAEGHGGLTGPLRVRVFRNEGHLVVFYPLYLIERWVRNGGLYFAGYYFNVEFKDGKYTHDWLYGDGKYSRIWYDY